MTIDRTSHRPGARLSLERISRSFGETRAVQDLSLELAPGSFTALLGPSGCGKSTLLTLIAGLNRPDAGSVTLDGRLLDGVPAERRPVGLVFQKPLLFPHLTVEANVAFGLRMARMPRQQARAAARDMLEKVQLSALAGRRMDELSGGQEQRVALARALVLSPRLLLLDEPFSQLDASLRAEMRTLVRTLAEQSKVTTLFVSHDQAEAVEIADDIALMLDGRLAGHARPEVFYTRPPSLTAARFFGVTNELPGRVTAGRFSTELGRISAPTDLADGPAVLVVRPESLRLVSETDPSPHPGELSLAGTAVGARFAGTHLTVDVALGQGDRVTVHAPLGTPVELGAPVTVTARPESCSVLPAPSMPP
jgi:ABC-type Fe3+/spermidine/putrescine transport system ATPase subunit